MHLNINQVSNPESLAVLQSQFKAHGLPATLSLNTDQQAWEFDRVPELAAKIDEILLTFLNHKPTDSVLLYGSATKPTWWLVALALIANGISFKLLDATATEASLKDTLTFYKIQQVFYDLEHIKTIVAVKNNLTYPLGLLGLEHLSYSGNPDLYSELTYFLGKGFGTVKLAV